MPKQFYSYNKNTEQPEDFLPLSSNGNPIGTIIIFGGNTLPSDYMLCDGSAISRTTYSELFTVIGTTYGTGNGSTTFNLPNFINRFLQGSSVNGTVKAAGLPEIYGQVDGNYLSSATGNAVGNFNSNYKGSGALRTWTAQVSNKYAYTTGTYWGASIGFKASAYNSIYGNSTTVQPPAVTIKYIIKYI